jgi:hypothetical protein
MKDETFNVMLVAMIVLFVAGLVLGCFLTRIEYQRGAIKAGVAYYNPTNANFEWRNLADANKTNK